MVNIQNNNRNTKFHILYFFGISLLITIIGLGYYMCPLNYVFGIPCPLCGMSRALLSALKFNFKEAFYYHAFWPLAIIIFPVNYIIKKSNIQINKKLENTIYIVIGVLLLIYYILRHYYSSPIVEIHYNESLLNNIINFFK